MPKTLTQDENDQLAEQAYQNEQAEIVAATPMALSTEVVPEGISGEYDQSDYSIPYVSLVQASSEAVKQRTAQPGAFLSSDGEQADSINMIPLHIRFVRDFYDKQGQKNICGSMDRVTGYPRDTTFFATHGDLIVPEGESLACRQCPFYEQPAGPKLACLRGYVVMMYDLDRDAPFLFRVRGTAVRPFKDRIVGAVAQRGIKPWARQFQMTSKLVSGGGNSWFVPELQPTKGLTVDEMQGWADYAAGMVPPTQVETVDHDDLPFE